MVTQLLKFKKYPRVALLATGDELTTGDILNTNGQAIASTLAQHHIEIGMHAVTADTQSDIKNALVFLLKTHDALIITGGLGPTSDDRTRFALAAAIRKPLQFDEDSWQSIVDRLKAYYVTLPESNRQQALFPKGAIIFENPNGTARGCGIYLQGKWVFMLPGPPSECLPMFEKNVLPRLNTSHFIKPSFRKNWLLFQVSEGQIATELDTLVDPFHASTGYRIAYPYLEFKLFSNDKAAFEQACAAVEKRVAPHLLSQTPKPISQLLLDTLAQSTTRLCIEDVATGGLLESRLSRPENRSVLFFHNFPDDAGVLHLSISGLSDYWSLATNTKETQLHLHFTGTHQDTQTHTLSFRPDRVLLLALEIICLEILKVLEK